MDDSIKLNFGFWNFNQNFWSEKSYKYDDSRIFDTNTLIVDTSTLNPEYYSISNRQKKIIRNHWISALPLLHDVEYLMTTHQIDQSFFEAICKMTNLKGLYIKWGKVESIENIKNLQKLKHIYFGSNPRISSLKGIESLQKLENLEIENFKSILDFSKLGNLINLKTLAVTGSINSNVTPMNDLYFLDNLDKLEEITLGISLKEKDVSPLYKYGMMKRLFLPATIKKSSLKS